MRGVRALGPMLAALAALGACTPMPPGPSFAARPAAGKPLAAFSDDDIACRNLAAAQVAPEVAAANEWSVAGVAAGAALGAGIGGGVAGGHGAAIGALSGAAAGTAVGAGYAGFGEGPLQQQYDLAYANCMVGRGDEAPGFAPPPHS